ncbi:hypothetical protein HID58_087726, partial [Brassica napus]
EMYLRERTLLEGTGLTYQEIVNIFLGDGSMRRGQVLGVDGEKSAVQTCPRIGKSAPVYITIGDGEKLKHQHHCKGSRGIKSSSSLRWRSFKDTERTKHLQNVSRIFDERQRLRVPDMEATMAWEMI